MEKLKTVFLGTPDFSVPSLEALFWHPLVDLKYVITMPDRRSGRGQKLNSPPVALFAKDNKIELIQTPNINKEKIILNQLKKENIDLVVVLAFSQFLSNEFLKIPKLGCFNIHTSLLPKYRGAAPIQYALLNGDNITGVTIFKIVKKMDAGDINILKSVKIENDETFGELYTKLKYLSALTLGSFIRILHQGKATYTAQDESKVSFAPTLKKEDGLIDFHNESRVKIANKIRALIPWPGCYFFIDKKRYKIIEIEFSDKVLEPAQIDSTMGFFIVGCSDKKTIRLKKLQCEGKKETTDTVLINAFKSRKENIIINP